MTPKNVRYFLRLDKSLNPTDLLVCGMAGQKFDHSILKGWQDQKLLAIHQKAEIVILLPSQWVYVTHCHIPSKNIEVIKQSLPFAIEEQLSNEVDENYYAFNMQENNEQLVAVIDIKRYQQVLNCLKKNQIVVEEIYSEFFLCAYQPNSCYLFVATDNNNLQNSYVVMRTGVAEGLTFNRSELGKMLQLFVPEDKNIYYYSLSEDDELKKSDYRFYQMENTLNNINVQSCPNLFQARLTEDDSKKSGFSLSRQLLVLFSIFLFSWVLTHVISHMRLSSDIAHISDEQKQLLQRLFPQVSDMELNDPYAALQSRLKAGGADMLASQESNMLMGLYHIGEAFSTSEQKVEIDAFRFIDNVIELNLSAESTAAINLFEEKLRQSSLKYEVSIGTKEVDENRLKTVITMRSL